METITLFNKILTHSVCPSKMAERRGVISNLSCACNNEGCHNVYQCVTEGERVEREIKEGGSRNRESERGFRK